MKKPRYKIRLAFLYIGSFIVSIAPLLICLIVNWSRYTKTPQDTIKLCLGGAIAVTFLFLKVIGKLHMPRRIVLFSIVFSMVYLLQAILNDLLLLSFMALLGEILDSVFFQRAIRITKENMLVSKTADKTAEQVEQVFKNYLGRI